MHDWIIHPYLLFGLPLAGVPVLLHLLMRQKPKRLPFPAFRFLKQRFRTNQRKLNLQNLLLLLLRIAVICVLCFALARPRLFANRTGSGTDRPVAAVLLVDTSPSMEYLVAGVSRLDDAKERARELLAEMDANSEVLVMDSGEDQDAAFVPIPRARERVEALRVRPGAGALNRPVERALKALEAQDVGEETPPRILYVFSDRTRASWDEGGVRPVVPDGVQVVYVDVGVEKPADLGIEQVEVIPPVVAPGTRYEVRVRVRGTLGGHENELSCSVEGDPQPAEKRPVHLAKEYGGDVFSFERTAPEPPADGPMDAPYQVTARLATRDALPVNNSRHATFLVRRGRRLLTITQTPAAARVWNAVHASTRSFATQTMTPEEAADLTPIQLRGYAVVCLFQTANVSVALWNKLTAYVRGGGGLAIVPGGEEAIGGLKEVNDGGTKAGLLPAPLEKLVSAPEGTPVRWQRFTGSHPLLAPFVAWARGTDPDFERDELRPSIRRYWQLGKLARDSSAIARYEDAGKNPALAERAVWQGRVVLFTSPLDIRQISPGVRWDNYLEASFGLVLIDRVCRYLGGEAAAPEMNFRCGVVPQVTPPAGMVGPLSLSGPGLTGAERNVKVPAAGVALALPQAVQPGNYRLLDARERAVAGFSLDVAPVETDLERHPAEVIEAVLGKESVVQVGRTVRLRDALAESRKPPLEFLPYLMMGLLVVLSFESLLANRFYRRAPEEAAPAGPATP